MKKLTIHIIFYVSIFILAIFNLTNTAFAESNDYNNSRRELIACLKKNECIFDEYCKDNDSNYEKIIIYINDIKRQFNEEYLKYGNNKKVVKITKHSLKNILENMNSLNDVKKHSYKSSQNNCEKYREKYKSFICSIEKNVDSDILECIYLNDLIDINVFMNDVLQIMEDESNTLEIKKMCCEYKNNIKKETKVIRKLLKNNFGE